MTARTELRVPCALRSTDELSVGQALVAELLELYVDDTAAHECRASVYLTRPDAERLYQHLGVVLGHVSWLEAGA